MPRSRNFKRPRPQKKSRRPRPQVEVLGREQLSITKEANYIISRAQNREGRLVTLGSLLLFSTETGDAWILDSEDGFALCLARDGVEQPHKLAETSDNFSIEWNADYHIEGDAFVVSNRAGAARTILGYPTREIMQATNPPT